MNYKHKFLIMRRIFTLFLFAILLGSYAMAQQNYDFSAACESGQTLYYKITSSTEPYTVEVVSQNTSSPYYSNDPTDNLEIPVSVEYDNITYSVTSIGSSAFRGCSELTSVTIGNSVTSIGEHAFSNCSGLTSVTIGNSITSIGDDAFSECTGLTFVNFNATNCTTMGGSLYPVFRNSNVNATINIGEGVTTIPDYAFKGLLGNGMLIIPSSVTSIGRNAFTNCSGLTSLTIGNSVTSIGYSAFEFCSGLTGTLTIPNSVTSIGGNAFSGCSGITSLTIGDSVEIIGTEAFSGLSSVSIVYFNATNCTRMGQTSSVFVMSAFYSCPLLTTLNIGENVTNIPKDAFKNCGALTTINYNAINCSPFNNNSNNGITGNANITTITIGENVEVIPDGAFYGCSGLSTVNFNATNCTSMGSPDALVFGGCTSLSTLNIGENVTNIPDNAFKSCSMLNGDLSLPNSILNVGVSAFDGCNMLESLTFGSYIASIGSYAFSECNGFSTLTIPSSLNSIGNNAFYNCGGLNYISVDSDNRTYDSRNNCNAIIRTSDNTLLLGCNNTTIPESVTSIESSAFYNCNTLRNLTIPKFVTSIGDDAFFGCSSMSEMVVNAVALNSNFTRSPYGPQGNASLKKVYIDSTVTRLPDYMFAGCSAIDTIMVNNTIPPIVYANTFDYANLSNIPVIVSCGAIPTYENANFWYNFRRIQQSASCPLPYTITVLSSNPNYGTVTGGGVYMENTTATLTATPYEECMFVNWNDGNTDNPREITVTEDATYIATFVRGTYNPTIYNAIADTACGSYTWNGDIYTESGEYQQTFTAANSVDSVVTLTLTILPLPEPVITVDGILDACNPETTSVTLHTGEYDSYIWSNAITGESAIVTTPGEYSVEVVDSMGCHGFSEGIFVGYSTILTEAPYITNVGMKNNGYNMLQWNMDATDTVGVRGFYIYREDAAANAFCFIKHINKPRATSFTDSTADPTARAYRYKICAVDECGGMSPVSTPHRTMHLTINKGIGNAWNLIWSPYEGLPIRSYRIYRGTTMQNMVVIGEVPGNQNSYTDNGNPYNAGFFYKIIPVKNTRSDDEEDEDIMLSSNVVDNGYIVMRTVIVAPSNPANGTASGSGSYPDGTIVTLWATANAGYEFSTWNDGSTENPRSVTITSDTLFIANFVEISQTPTFTITVYSSNQAYGTVSGGGTYEEGSEIQLIATANNGYEFVSWSDGSIENPHTITVTEDAMYIATFIEAQSIRNFTVSVISANPAQGTVTGGGSYPEGTEITIEAIANEGYEFISWSDNNTENPRQITVTADAMYIATFMSENGVDEFEATETEIFPNPATDILNITSSETISEIEIVNVMGQVVKRVEANSDNVTCDVEELKAGVYMVRIYGSSLRRAEPVEASLSKGTVISQRKFVKE